MKVLDLHGTVINEEFIMNILALSKMEEVKIIDKCYFFKPDKTHIEYRFKIINSEIAGPVLFTYKSEEEALKDRNIVLDEMKRA